MGITFTGCVQNKKDKKYASYEQWAVSNMSITEGICNNFTKLSFDILKHI